MPVPTISPSRCGRGPLHEDREAGGDLLAQAAVIHVAAPLRLGATTSRKTGRSLVT